MIGAGDSEGADGVGGRRAAGPTGKKLRFVELRAEGRSYRAIAEILGVSKNTLTAWANELREEIRHARALELDALLEAFELNEAARLRRIGTTLRLLQKEAEGRDLRDVPTARLYQLLLQFEGMLRDAVPMVEPPRRVSEGQNWDKAGTPCIAELVRERAHALLADLGDRALHPLPAVDELRALALLLAADEQATLAAKLEHIEEMLGARSVGK